MTAATVKRCVQRCLKCRFWRCSAPNTTGDSEDERERGLNEIMLPAGQPLPGEPQFSTASAPLSPMSIVAWVMQMPVVPDGEAPAQARQVRTRANRAAARTEAATELSSLPQSARHLHAASYPMWQPTEDQGFEDDLEQEEEEEEDMPDDINSDGTDLGEEELPETGEPPAWEAADAVMRAQAAILQEFLARANPEQRAAFESRLRGRYSSTEAAMLISRLPHEKWSYNYIPDEDGAEGDLECRICLSEYEPGDEVLRLPCMHYGHSSCMEAWLRRNPRCPMCRLSVRDALEADQEYEDEQVEQGGGEWVWAHTGQPRPVPVGLMGRND